MTPNPPPPNCWRRRARRCAVVVGVLVAGWLAASYTVANKLTRRSTPRQVEATPDIAWGTVEPLRLTSSDGQELGAWLIDGRADRPPVLLLHGNGESRTECLRQAELAASGGSPVLTVTLRAHGDSTGELNDLGYGARLDALAAMDWLEKRCPGRRAVAWGRSLGAAAAVFAAPDLGERVGAYLLECPYRDLRTAVRNRTRVYLPPVVDAVADTGIGVVAPLVLPHADAISPVKAAPRMPVSAKVLILAGSADRRATAEEARDIAAAIGERAEVVVIDGGDHLQLEAVEPETYRRAVRGFIDRCQ